MVICTGVFLFIGGVLCIPVITCMGRVYIGVVCMWVQGHTYIGRHRYVAIPRLYVYRFGYMDGILGSMFICHRYGYRLCMCTCRGMGTGVCSLHIDVPYVHMYVNVCTYVHKYTSTRYST